MKHALTALLATCSMSMTANAEWETRITGQWNKFALCSSNTGTDGDLLFEVPVILQEKTSIWQGEDTEHTKKGHTYVQENILVESTTKSGYLADVTDVSPMSKYALKMKMTRFSDSFDITLPRAGYRIILPFSVSEQGEFQAADQYQDEIGVSNCALEDTSYNERFKDLP